MTGPPKQKPPSPPPPPPPEVYRRGGIGWPWIRKPTSPINETNKQRADRTQEQIDQMIERERRNQ